MAMLAWRNLIHDKVRLGVTLTGIVFAVVLIVVEFGLFIGFTTTTSGLIDRSGADLWIIGERVPYVDLGAPFSERKLAASPRGLRHSALATRGVAAQDGSRRGLCMGDACDALEVRAVHRTARTE